MKFWIEQRKDSDIFEMEINFQGDVFLFEASLDELLPLAAKIAAAIEGRTV